MKISPEPLCPLRKWRELWQSDHATGAPGTQDAAPSQTDHWKQPKRSRFNWFNHLFHRQTPK
jgi:hypothetical protein